MSDTSPVVPVASDATTLLSAQTVLGAVSDPVRLSIVRALADGAQLSVNELAAKVGRSPDLVSKHLRVLRDARIVATVNPPGADGRRQHQEIPAPFRTRDAAGRVVLDFGAVLLRP